MKKRTVLLNRSTFLCAALLLALGALAGCAAQPSAVATQAPATTAAPAVTAGAAVTEAPGSATPAAAGATSPAETQPAATQSIDTPPAATHAVNPQSQVSGADDLVAALQSAGASVTVGEAVPDSYFNVGGKFLKVNGQDVQVFEFPNEAARQTAAATIQANGFIVGNAALDWVGQPYFFSTGRMIVLYVGGEDATLNLLRSVLSEPITGN